MFAGACRCNIILDKHHVDDEIEAIEYINNHVNNAVAFQMKIASDDSEQDCTPVAGTMQYHEFRYVLGVG